MDFLKKRDDFGIMKKLIHSCTFPSNDTLSQRKGYNMIFSYKSRIL